MEGELGMDYETRVGVAEQAWGPLLSGFETAAAVSKDCDLNTF